MLWLITRVNADKPGNVEARDSGLKQHRDYLHSKGDILLLSGSLQNDEGTQSVGSMFVVKANSRSEAKAFVDGDPFTQAGYYSEIKFIRLRKGGGWNPKVMEGE
jgi:uncharacterized protein YciI